MSLRAGSRVDRSFVSMCIVLRTSVQLTSIIIHSTEISSSFIAAEYRRSSCSAAVGSLGSSRRSLCVRAPCAVRSVLLFPLFRSLRRPRRVSLPASSLHCHARSQTRRGRRRPGQRGCQTGHEGQDREVQCSQNDAHATGETATTARPMTRLTESAECSLSHSAASDPAHW